MQWILSIRSIYPHFGRDQCQVILKRSENSIYSARLGSGDLSIYFQVFTNFMSSKLKGTSFARIALAWKHRVVSPRINSDSSSRSLTSSHPMFSSGGTESWQHCQRVSKSILLCVSVSLVAILETRYYDTQKNTTNRLLRIQLHGPDFTARLL